MREHFHILFIFFLLIFAAAPQSIAATTAEAAIGGEKKTDGIYDISGMSEDEREWFFTFLKGNLLADGWERISSDILMSTRDQEREEQQERLDELGYKIGREWCKGNDIRRIHTAMLRKWGRELQDTADEAPHLLTEVLQRIDTEINELLN